VHYRRGRNDQEYLSLESEQPRLLVYALWFLLSQYILPHYFRFNLLSTFISCNPLLSHSPVYFLPLCTYSLYYTFLPHFNSLHTLLLLCHSICFMLHKMLDTLILYLLYVLDIPPIRFVFQVTQKDLRSSPDDGRLLPKHVGASI
jgi:hypothetical protein